MAKKSKSRRRPSSSPERLRLTPEEQSVALNELGLTQRDLSYSRPTWAYAVGALIVVGSFAVAGRIMR
jgi:hypothetical protein